MSAHNKGPAESTEPMLPLRAAAASHAPQRFQRLQHGQFTASAAICRPRGVESLTPDLAMPRDFSNAELHRPLFAQIPLELLSSCAEIGRRRLVFVYAWLWFYAGQGDVAFPSVPRLALECGMKDRDIRAAIATLLEERWIVKAGTGPRGTNVYRVRMEAKRKKQRPKPTAAERKTAAPLPPGGRPPRGTPPSPLGASPSGAPLPPGGTPPQGEAINKPLNEEQEKLEGLITTQKINMPQEVENDSLIASTVTTAHAVVTDQQIVVTSADNDAPQRHAEPVTGDLCPPAAEQNSHQATAQKAALPDCARPHRQLLVEWWTRRKRKHPDAPTELSAADLQAIHHADALGVLQPFLEHAAASGCKSLSTGYRRRCEQLRAGPAASAAFEQLCAVHLASPRRATSQSLPAAQRELAVVLAEGYSIEALVAAHGAELAAQEQQLAKTGFAPSFPDLLRWLKERRFVAYLPQHQPAAVAAVAFVAPIDPETGESDPFAYHRHLTGR